VTHASRGVHGAPDRRARGGEDVVSSVEVALRGFGLGAGNLLVAVSGGIDSMVLLEVLLEIRNRNGEISLGVGHVHHGLRGLEADADEAAVREAARCRGLPFASERVQPRERVAAAASSRERPTLQEAARELRYAALRGLAARIFGAASSVAIATAHTADDQAETVLLRLLRGCGPAGLAGIPPRSSDGSVVRPLLGVSRARIEAFASVRGLRWREDSSNASRRYARNRLRHEWLPGLAREFNPQLLNTLAQLAESQRRDSEWIDDLVTAEASRRFCVDASDGSLRVDLHGWAALPPALGLRLWRRAWIGRGGGRDLERSHLERLQAFALGGRSGRVLELPGGVRAHRRGGQVVLTGGRGEAPAGDRPIRC